MRKTKQQANKKQKHKIKEMGIPSQKHMKKTQSFYLMLEKECEEVCVGVSDRAAGPHRLWHHSNFSYCQRQQSLLPPPSLHCFPSVLTHWFGAAQRAVLSLRTIFSCGWIRVWLTNLRSVDVGPMPPESGFTSEVSSRVEFFFVSLLGRPILHADYMSNIYKYKSIFLI